MSFKVIFLSHAERAFASLTQADQQLIKNKLGKLAEDFFGTPNIKKLHDFNSRYRLRVGRWRVLFSVFKDDSKIEIADIFMEKGAKDYKRRQKLF